MHADSHQLDLAWTPRLVKERLQRAVEAQEDKVTLLGDGLDPVAALDPIRLYWSEIDSRGAVGVRLGSRRWIALTAGAWVPLRVWSIERD